MSTDLTPGKLRGPDYEGGSLVNLVAELEERLTGKAVAPRLHKRLASLIPAASTYVIMVMDGLGALQLEHPAAAELAKYARGELDAPFPTTTSVSLSSLSAGMVPAQHGVLGYMMMLEDDPRPVNTLRWSHTGGENVDQDPRELLPYPNLWERLDHAGVERVVVQPHVFAHTPLTRALYRGCYHAGVNTHTEMVDTVLMWAKMSGRRLIKVYVPHVDQAAHISGMQSGDYEKALGWVSRIWSQIAEGLPEGVVMVGTADHGMIDYSPENRFRIFSSDYPGLTMFGDPRSLYVRGPAQQIAELSRDIPADWFPLADIEHLWGPANGVVRGVRPDGMFLARPDWVLLPGTMDMRLIGYHGGLDPRELTIPLLVASKSIFRKIQMREGRERNMIDWGL